MYASSQDINIMVTQNTDWANPAQYIYCYRHPVTWEVEHPLLYMLPFLHIRSFQQLTTGWCVRGSNPTRRTVPNSSWPFRLQYIAYTVSFLGVNNMGVVPTTHHPLLAPASRMGRAIAHLPPAPVYHVTRLALYILFQSISEYSFLTNYRILLETSPFLSTI